MNSLELLLSSRMVEAFASSGQKETLVKLSESLVKSLARYAHPDALVDLPDSVRESLKMLYVEMTQALEDIKDPDGLELSLQEIMSPRRLAAVQQRISAEIRTNWLRTTNATLVQLLANTNQLQLLGESQATTLLMDFMGKRLVLDVMSPSQTVLSAATTSDEEIPAHSMSAENMSFRNGLWAERGVVFVGEAGKEKTKTVQHKLRTLSDAVTLVGWVPRQAFESESSVDYAARTQLSLLSGGDGEYLTLSPTSAEDAWYVDKMEPIHSPGAQLVGMIDSDKFMLLGDLLAKAPLMT